MYHILRLSGLFRNDLLVSEFNIMYTTYAMRTWTKIAVTHARRWKAKTLIESLTEETGQNDYTHRLHGDIVFRQEKSDELQSFFDDSIENCDPIQMYTVDISTVVRNGNVVSRHSSCLCIF